VVSIDAGGSMPSAVGVDADGHLQVVGADGPPLSHETVGFVDALGGSEPIMVGATPYGPEALVSAVFSGVIAAGASGSEVLPDAFAIVHDDDLDPFRASLLTEAARLAGIPAERIRLVTRTAARAAAVERNGDDPAGAALVALAEIPDDDDSGGGAAIAAAGGLAAGGAVGLGVHLAEGGTAAAAAPAAGPAGVPLAGPSGATVGPTGTPLGSAGPTGTPLGSAGPTGTPLGGAGPAGTPLDTAGPAGTPLDTAGAPSVAGAAPKPRPRWLPAAAVGGAVAVVAVVGVVVLAQGDDEPPEGAAATTTVVAVAEPVATDAPQVTAIDPTTPVTEPVAATTEVPTTGFDTSAFLGEWQQQCEPFLPGDGASTGRYLIEPAGPDQLALTISGIDFPTVECVGEGEVTITQGATLTILGETVVEGRDAYFGESDIGAFVIAVDGDTLYLGEGSAFDPSATATRR
jgi:hypothetical protein